MTTRDDVNDLAQVLIDAWDAVEREPVGVSYVATFADMARAAIAAGWTPPDGSKDAGWDLLVEAHADLLVASMRVVELAAELGNRCVSPGTHTTCVAHRLQRFLGMLKD